MWWKLRGVAPRFHNETDSIKPVRSKHALSPARKSGATSGANLLVSFVAWPTARTRRQARGPQNVVGDVLNVSSWDMVMMRMLVSVAFFFRLRQMSSNKSRLGFSWYEALAKRTKTKRQPIEGSQPDASAPGEQLVSPSFLPPVQLLLITPNERFLFPFVSSDPRHSEEIGRAKRQGSAR